VNASSFILKIRQLFVQPAQVKLGQKVQRATPWTQVIKRSNDIIAKQA